LATKRGLKRKREEEDDDEMDALEEENRASQPEAGTSNVVAGDSGAGQEQAPDAEGPSIIAVRQSFNPKMSNDSH